MGENMSRKWLVIAGLMMLCAAAVLFSSCSEDKGPIDTGAKDTLFVKSVSTAPDTSAIIDDPLWDDADELSVRVGEDENYTDDLKLGIVKTRAIADSAYIYVRFNWRDSSQSIRPGFWTYQVGPDCNVWTQNADSNCTEINNAVNPRWENEDVLALLLDMGNNGDEKASCNTTCHTDADTNDVGYQHYTTGDGNIDGWVWRAGRTNPLGLADDQCWGPKSQLRRDDSYQTPPYWQNLGNGAPAWMHKTGPAYTGNHLFVADTVALDWVAAWVAKDGVPGYALNSNWNFGNVSRYDVKCKASYDDQLKRWTVVMWRRLTTPYTTEDVNFKDGRNKYQATLAIMDHAFRRHSGSKPFTVKLP
jgi:hypothetical protein